MTGLLFLSEKSSVKKNGRDENLDNYTPGKDEEENREDGPIIIQVL